MRDASVIEQLGNIDHVVFDKTGTLTKGTSHFTESGHKLTDEEKEWVYSVVSISQHPYSKALAAHVRQRTKISPDEWEEYAGKGIAARIGNNRILVGSAAFTGAGQDDEDSASVYVKINDKLTSFHLEPDYRDDIAEVVPRMKKEYGLSLLSGDNDKQEPVLRRLFGDCASLLFYQKPMDKLKYIEDLRYKGGKVLMVGDGLNDAGALQQSNVGITLADDVNNFTPSCDAILDAKRFGQIPALLKLAKRGRTVINISFVISILYNIVGLTISVQGEMSPMIAAILMPASTLSIVLVTTGASSIIARRLGLSLKKH
jgi:Cu+-exporting ATPase